MTRVVIVLFEDEMSEEKTEQPQLDKRQKQYTYIDKEGNQEGASTDRMISEDDVSQLSFDWDGSVVNNLSSSRWLD